MEMIRNIGYVILALACTHAAPIASLADGQAGGNILEVSQLSSDQYRVQVSVDSYQLVDGIPFDCDIVGAVMNQQEGELPTYSHVVEIAGGRSAVIQSLSLDKNSIKVANETASVQDDKQPVEVTVGRMGKRSFLRIGVNPFIMKEAGLLEVNGSIDAVIQINEATATPRSKRRSLLESVTNNNTDCISCPVRLVPEVTAGDGNANDFVSRRSVTSDVAWKVCLTEPGLYRITGEELANADMPPALRDTTLLKVTTQGQEVPIWKSTHGLMDTNDWIMFYGAALDSVYSTQNIYWISVEGSSPVVSTWDASTNGLASVVSSTWSVVNYSPRNLFRSRYRPQSDMPNWFAMFIRSSSASNLSLATPFPVGSEPARMSVRLHGKGPVDPFDPDHQNDFYIGTNLLHGITYKGEITTNVNFEFSAALLSTSVTTFVLDQPVPTNVPQIIVDFMSDENAASYIESVQLCFQRSLQVNEMPFYFAGPTNISDIRLTGLSDTNVLLLDVTVPTSPIELVGYTVESNAGSWSLEFAHSNNAPRCYVLFSSTAASSASSINLVHFRNLARTNRQADYLAVSPDTFKEPVYRLLKHRYKNGLSVQVASPDDVYNEFSYGIKDPRAIRQYFGYSYHHYALPGPEYALLMGNGSLDPMNDLGNYDPDLIPVRMGWSVINRTSIDQWFVTIDGSDILPDVKLGRVPVAAVSNAEFFVSKLIDFETSPTNSAWFETALLVADDTNDNNNIDFKAFTEANTVVHLTNGGFDSAFGIIPGYLDDFPGAAQLRTAINAELDLGLQIVNYIGHGAEERWALENVWNNDDALSRMNTVYPIVSVFTCENGAFHKLDFTLAEAIVLGEFAGSACLAPSTFAINFNSEQIADGYFAAIATNRVDRLGDALEEGFFRLWSINGNGARELLFYTIMGDPAQQIWGGAEP